MYFKKMMLISALIWACTGLTLTGGAAPAEGGQNIPGKILDMTYPFGDHSIYWPTGKSFKAKPVFWGINDKGWWYASNDYSANEHGVTHVDAPIHFYQKGVEAVKKLSFPGFSLEYKDNDAKQRLLNSTIME